MNALTEHNRSLATYAVALKYLGVAEIPGHASNPVITHWINQAATWLDHDDSSTPWCGCFRGAVGLEAGTGVVLEHFRAKNWLHYGVPVDTLAEAKKGDTIVFCRKGGFHVALFDHLVNGKLFCLGGNQSDKVSIAPQNISSIEGIRR